MTCPFWAVVLGRGLKPFEVALAPFIQVKRPSTHNRLLLCHVDQLGQLQRWKQAEWSDIRALRDAQERAAATEMFLLRYSKLFQGKKGTADQGSPRSQASLESRGRDGQSECSGSDRALHRKQGKEATGKQAQAG